ncbi:MAG TPA: efflux RND transporter periplasmic adaptor subunit [Anaerolineae bacterium]|nr:efflux RND transporter periplasmic adaptor subunit [Anaerolineae bacterium]
MKYKFGIFLLAIASISLFLIACAGAPTPTPAAAPPSALSEALVTAKGEVVPEEYARVAFDIGGTVEKISVKEGDEVKAGDVLAQLDTTDLQLQVKNAQDALALAQATLIQTKTPATAEEIAAAQAAYDSALAVLNRTKQGPTADELAAAQAAYNSALTAYNTAKNGPTGEDLQILQSQLAKAKAAVDQAQAAYDRIGGASNPFNAATPQALALQQATQDYQIALSNYNKAIHPDATTVAQAQANLAQAQSNLQKLKDSPRAEDIAQAQAQVDSAKATLDLKKKGARLEDIDVAQKHVDQAQTGLEQAQAQLEKATLKSPLDGTVTYIAIREGELAQPGAPVVTVADLTNLKVQTTDLDEFGAAKVQLGQPVKIRVNAFTDKTLNGKVSQIADQSVLLASGDVSYPVTIILDQQDPSLRWGMTVKVEFQQ